jgi:hypothetical protein
MAPAIAVKHGQGPHILGSVMDMVFQYFSQSVQICPPVGIDNPFGQSGGAAGIVNGDGQAFIIDAKMKGFRFNIQEILVIRPVKGFCRNIADIDDFNIFDFIQDWLNRGSKFRIDKQNFTALIFENISDFFG